MKLKGDWSGGTTYNVGEMVRYTDGVFYWLQKPCDAGVHPVDTRYWGKVNQTTAEAAGLIMDGLESVLVKIPTNINDEAITLKGTGDTEYLVTVDDSGDTPELEVTLIEEEGE